MILLEDFNNIFIYKLFERLNKSCELIFIIVLFLSVNYNNFCNNIDLLFLANLMFRQEAIESVTFIVKLLLLLIFIAHLLVHHFFVNFWDKRDNKVQQNNEKNELVQKPNKVNHVNDHCLSCILVIFLNPIINRWWLNISNTIFKD